MTRPIILGAALLSTILLVALRADPQRDGVVRSSSSQSARISGTVTIGDDEPQPVRRAIVSASGRSRDLSFDTVTDDHGRFDLAGLPTGAYSLTVTRPPYVGIAFGASRPEWPGTPVVIGVGEHVAGIRMRLVRGAVITGTVRDQHGQVMPEVDIWVERRGIRATYVRSGTVVTDDTGTYRAFGLPAGTYRVSARPRGSLNDVHVPSDADNDTAFRILELGGRMWPQAKSSSLALTEPDKAGIVPVYHPAAVLPDDAQSIVLRAGDEARGVDIELRPRRSTLVNGRLTSAMALPLGATFLTLTRSETSVGSATARVGDDGAFSFGRVPPGRYFLVARSMHPDNLRRVLSLAAASPSSPIGIVEDACGVVAQSLELGDSDIPPLQITMEPCFRVVAGIEGIDDASAGNLGPTVSLTLVAEAAGLGRSRMTTLKLNRSGPSRVELSEAGALVPGKYYLEAVVAEGDSREWSVDSALLDGRDLTDEAQYFGQRGRDVEVTLRLSRRTTLLTGSLETVDARPAVDYTVVAFPVDRSLWTGTFRRVKVTRPSTDGQFEIHGLPSGDYLLAAVRDVAPDEWREQSFLAEIATMAIRVSVTPGTANYQRLRVADGRH